MGMEDNIQVKIITVANNVKIGTVENWTKSMYERSIIDIEYQEAHVNM